MSKKFVNHFANLAERVARERFGLGKKVAGLEIPSTYATTTKTIAQSCIDRSSIIYGMEALESLASQEEVSKESGMILQYPDSNEKIISPNEMKGVQVIVSPGLGGYKNLQGTLGEFKRLFPEQNCAIYLPKNEVNDLRARYFNGMNYYINENSVNFSESDNFLHKVILPKITDEKNHKLLPPEKCDRFILANFSIGCRESYSHMRHFVNHLRQAGVEEGNVKKYLDRVLMINVGSPVNWGGGTSEVPSSINIVSIEDMGSKKPEDFMSTIYCNTKMHLHPLSKLVKATYHNSCVEALYVMGPKMVSNGGDRGSGSFMGNPFAHGLPNYIDGIQNIPELMGVINNYKTCLLKSTTDREVDSLTKDAISDNATRYLPTSIFDPKGVERLLETVHAFTGREDRAREEFNNNKNKPKSDIQITEAYSMCEESQVGPETFVDHNTIKNVQNNSGGMWVALTEESRSNARKGGR